MTRQFGGVEPGSTMPAPTKPRRSATAYVLAHPVGRLAVVVVAFAAVGLLTHFWVFAALALALPRLRVVEVTA
jgi:hypothetical protein